MTSALWAMDHEEPAQERKNEEPEKEIIDSKGPRPTGPRKSGLSNLKQARETYAIALEVLNDELASGEEGLLSVVQEVIERRLELYHSLIANLEILKIDPLLHPQIQAAYSFTLLLDVQKTINRSFKEFEKSCQEITIDGFLMQVFPEVTDVNTHNNVCSQIAHILKLNVCVKDCNSIVNLLPKGKNLQQYIDLLIEDPLKNISSLFCFDILDYYSFNYSECKNLIFYFILCIELNLDSIEFFKVPVMYGNIPLYYAFENDENSIIEALSKILTHDQFCELLKDIPDFLNRLPWPRKDTPFIFSCLLKRCQEDSQFARSLRALFQGLLDKSIKLSESLMALLKYLGLWKDHICNTTTNNNCSNDDDDPGSGGAIKGGNNLLLSGRQSTSSTEATAAATSPSSSGSNKQRSPSEAAFTLGDYSKLDVQIFKGETIKNPTDCYTSFRVLQS